MSNEDRFLLGREKEVGPGIDMANLLALIQKLFEANQNIRKANIDRLNFVRGKLSHVTQKATELGRNLAGTRRTLSIYRDACYRHRLELKQIANSWPDDHPIPDVLRQYRTWVKPEVNQETACGGTGV